MNSKQIFEYQKGTSTFEETINHSDFSHVRFDEPWACFQGTDSEFRHGSFKIYFRCSDSPSGVLMAASFHATPENKKALAARNLRANLGPSRGDIACAHPCGTVSF